MPALFVRMMGLWLPGAVLLDMVVPVTSLAFSAGVTTTVYLLLVIIAGEGLTLRLLNRAHRWRTVWSAAVAMNVVSTAAGFVLVRPGSAATDLLGIWLGAVRGLPGRGYAESLSEPGALVDWFAAFAFLWLVTTLIEAVVLYVVRRDGRPWRSLGHSAAVNAVSYVLLAVGLLLVMQRPFTPPL